MASTKPNPYAPPQTEPGWDAPTPSMAGLDPPIQFSGAVEEQEIREFLRHEGDPGILVPVLLLASVGLVAVVMFIQGGGVAAVGLGLMGLLVTSLAVSTFAYRRRLFVRANPQWSLPVRGQWRVDGVHLDRGDTEVFFRWDWFGGAVWTQHWVALLPATQPDHPQFVALRMLDHGDDWRRVLEVAVAVSQTSEGKTGEHRRQRNFRLLRDGSRDRSMTIPGDAIPFAGNVRNEDFERLPNHQGRPSRSWQAKAVLVSLLASGSLILSGAASIFFAEVAILAGFVIIYLVIAAIGVAMRLRRRGDRRDVVYFMHAIASESSIVTDFAVTATEAKWSSLSIVVSEKNFIALRRHRSIQTIIARRDMFAGDDDWRRFVDLMSRKLDQSA